MVLAANFYDTLRCANKLTEDETPSSDELKVTGLIYGIAYL